MDIQGLNTGEVLMGAFSNTALSITGTWAILTGYYKPSVLNAPVALASVIGTLSIVAGFTLGCLWVINSEPL